MTPVETSWEMLYQALARQIARDNARLASWERPRKANRARVTGILPAGVRTRPRGRKRAKQSGKR